jgi:hypothetical protein
MLILEDDRTASIAKIICASFVCIYIISYKENACFS